jgi:Outer membrane protein beta-barrel domain
MSKINALALCTVILASCCVCAQDYPRFELSAGYSYGSVDTQGYSNQRDAQGWSGSLTTNLKKWVGLETEVSGRYNNLTFAYQGNNLSYNSSYYAFLAGPRLAHRRGKATPFVHGLFGVERAPSYSSTVYDPATLLATTPYDTGFASAAGGGVDYALSRRLSFRTQADYFFTRYATTLTPTPNNFRILAAFVFNFGGVESLSAKQTKQPSAKPQAAPTVNAQIPAPPEAPPQSASTEPLSASTAAANPDENDSEPIPVLETPVGVEPSMLSRPAASGMNANVQAPAPKSSAPITQIQSVKTAAASGPAVAIGQNTVLISSASQLQAASQQRQEEPLGDIARRYRNKKQPADREKSIPQSGL